MIKTKFISLALSLMLATVGINATCSANENLPAESLVIKKLHLGMSTSEAIAALKDFSPQLDYECREDIRNVTYYFNKFLYCRDIKLKFVNNRLNEVGFNLEIFNAKDANIIDFVESFISAYKISSYFDKIFKESSPEKYFGEIGHQSYCNIRDKSPFEEGLECKNDITGLSIKIKNYAIYNNIEIKRSQTTKEKNEEKKQKEEVEERKRQEDVKNMKFN